MEKEISVPVSKELVGESLDLVGHNAKQRYIHSI